MAVLRMDTDQVSGLISELRLLSDLYQGEIKNNAGRITSVEHVWVSRSRNEFCQQMVVLNSRLQTLARDANGLQHRLQAEMAEWEEAARTIGGPFAGASGSSPTTPDGLSTFLDSLVGRDEANASESFYFKSHSEIGVPLHELGLPLELSLSGEIEYRVTRQIDGNFLIRAEGLIGKGLGSGWGIVGANLKEKDTGAVEFVVDPKDPQAASLIRTMLDEHADPAARSQATVALLGKGIHAVEVKAGGTVGVEIGGSLGVVEGGLNVEGGIQIGKRFVNDQGHLRVEDITSFDLAGNKHASLPLVASASDESKVHAVVIQHRDFQDARDLLKAPTHTTIEFQYENETRTAVGPVIELGPVNGESYKLQYEFDNSKVSVQAIYDHIQDANWLKANAESAKAYASELSGTNASVVAKIDKVGGIDVGAESGREVERQTPM